METREGHGDEQLAPDWPSGWRGRSEVFCSKFAAIEFWNRTASRVWGATVLYPAGANGRRDFAARPSVRIWERAA